MTDPYASGVLVKEHHARLVANLPAHAADAGIMPHWIYSPLPAFIGEAERRYLLKIKQHMTDQDRSGICYVGKAKTQPIDQRMSAVAGALLRNFIRARVLTLGQVLDQATELTANPVSALFIPNFYLTAAEGGTIASWQVSSLYDLITARHLTGQQTFLYVSDDKQIAKEYGLAFAQLLDSSFLKVGV